MRPDPFSSRTHWTLEPNPIAKKLGFLKKQGVPILDLTESNPTRCGFSYPKEILSALSQKENLRYEPDPKGMRKARQVVARYLGVDPGNVILTASTSEAFSYLFRLLANPGDEILVPQPSYPLLDYLAGISDVTLKPYPLIYEGRWFLETPSVTPKTRALVVIHPNNPTGNFLKQAELAGLNEIARRHHLALISDEVFCGYSFSEDSKRVRTLSGNQKVLTFTLGGISKQLGLPQMKLAWIAVSGPERLRRSALGRLEVIADTFLSVSTPAQNAFESWFRAGRRVQQEIRERIRANREFLIERIRAAPSLECLHAEGGWSVILRVPSTHSEEEWVMTLLEKDHVLVQPGYFYDFPNEAYLVVSLLPEEKIFCKGIARILKRILYNTRLL